MDRAVEIVKLMKKRREQLDESSDISIRPEPSLFISDQTKAQNQIKSDISY
jgi:hypothetical protein